MCSTCDYKKFKQNNKRLEQNLGNGSLLICCDTNGKNYKLSVKDEPNSDYSLYNCPTCGRKLY